MNGAKVKVPTVEGPVMLTVAPGSSSGKTLRLKGKGFTRKDGDARRPAGTLEIALPEGDDDSPAGSRAGATTPAAARQARRLSTAEQRG